MVSSNRDVYKHGMKMLAAHTVSLLGIRTPVISAIYFLPSIFTLSSYRIIGYFDH